MGFGSPDSHIILAGRFTWGFPAAMVLSNAHLFSQMSARKISKQYCPIASLLLKPVIDSAARLKDVILFLRSIVRTPSLMLSKIARQGDPRKDVISENAGGGLAGALNRYVPGVFSFSFEFKST